MDNKTKTGIGIAAAAGATLGTGAVVGTNRLIRFIFDPKDLSTFEKMESVERDSKSVSPNRVPDAKIRMRAEANAAWLCEATDEWLREIAVERVTRTTEGGLQNLVGYIYHSPKPTRRWVILVHGYRGTHSEMEKYGFIYSAHGFNVLAVDLRSHGESDGRFIGMGYNDGFDLLDWTRYLVERFGSDIDIVLHGQSMGAATVLMASGYCCYPQVAAVIADSAYTSVWDILSLQLRQALHLPAAPLLAWMNVCFKAQGGYDLRAGSMVDAVRTSAIPTLFIHGGVDTFVPPTMAPRLYAACTAELKELHVIPGAGHIMSVLLDPSEYEAIVEGFLIKVGESR